MSNGGDWGTAPATPGLLNILFSDQDKYNQIYMAYLSWPEFDTGCPKTGIIDILTSAQSLFTSNNAIQFLNIKEEKTMVTINLLEMSLQI